MPTQRFLGGAWASVHGPSDPHRMLVWVLDQGFSGVGAAPGPRAVDWTALRTPLADLPASVPSVRSSGVLDAGGGERGSLASTHDGERRVARLAVEKAVLVAHAVGCPRVVVDPGPALVSGEVEIDDLGDPSFTWTEDRGAAERARRDARLDPALEAVCRELYALCRAHPDVEFCLTGSRHVHGIGEPRALEHVLGDLSSYRLGYWHDVGLAARHEEVFGIAQGEWLEVLGNRMVGMTLGDSADGRVNLPPGAGGVDYPLVAAYRRRSGHPVPAVVELDPAVEPGEIPGAHAFLTKYGL